MTGTVVAIEGGRVQWIRVSDCYIIDEDAWIIRGDWVVCYNPQELVRLGCTPEQAKEIARQMLNDARRQYYSLKKHRRFYFVEDDVDELLLEHPFYPSGCRKVGKGR